MTNDQHAFLLYEHAIHDIIEAIKAMRRVMSIEDVAIIKELLDDDS